MKYLILTGALVYIAGFCLMFWLHTQLPVTFGLVARLKTTDR